MEIPFGRRALAVVGAAMLLAPLACAGPQAQPKPEKAGKGAGQLTSVSPVASGLRTPLDAAPSPDGTWIYFTAMGADSSSLWKVPFDGGAQPVELATGFTAPIGVAVSHDGKTVYVADVASEQPDTDMLGHVAAVPAEGGVAEVLENTVGLAPKGLETTADALLITGRDEDGVRGLFRMNLADGVVEPMFVGAPFADPSGIVAADDGTVYVSDASGSFNETGAVIRVTPAEEGAVAEAIVQNLHVGSPAGITLVHDESALLVSGLDVTGTGGAQVYRIELDGLEIATANAGISHSGEAAGLHRARDVDCYAWGGAEQVFALK